ncbi:ribbon-helix-helix protein, CopG family [Nitratireductor sp. ZSWI3]|uniref:ribbon-helix-helix protein, CopG family n=1 Tax=Nitratireductor sp. ZSWI3 TaxID=2966359 RepID=UPI00214FC2A1|nr:ribbon-helix-helix protein, CopG family [Nitratireductor sp. ZSWI3]MCR4266409.1 ribbon-helix-helix protein, CopG family [Nitratireductor sp. ZSWI3]
MAAKHRVTINLIESEYEALVALSEKNRVSLAWLGRRAIRELLDRYQEGQDQLPLTDLRDESRNE